MRTSDVRAFLKTDRAIAEILGITVQAVNQWGELVPPLSAARLAKKTANKLQFDPDLYHGWNGKRGKGA
jgi:hypothetical protein